MLKFHVDYFKPEGEKDKPAPKPGEAIAKKAVIDAILARHDQITSNRKFNAVLATASINDAIAYHELFTELQDLYQKADPDFRPLKIACVFSPPAEGNPDVKQLQEDLPQEQADNLTPKDQLALDQLFKSHPIIEELYQRQMNLRSLLKLKTLSKDSCRKHIAELTDMLSELDQCGLQSMKTLSQTLMSWSEEIVRMWRFTRSNGITEGYHRKMKLIQRRAYGFRNFENYRLRVIAQCG